MHEIYTIQLLIHCIHNSSISSKPKPFVKIEKAWRKQTTLETKTELKECHLHVKDNSCA